MSKKAISWRAKDYQYKKKSIDWYYILIISFLSISGAIYYFFQDLIFSVLFLTILVVTIIISRKKPIVRKYSITNEEFILDNQTISFKEIEGYLIDNEHYKILLNTTDKYKPLVQIPFEPNQNMTKVNEFLEKKITLDKKLKIPFIELVLLKLLGF